MATTGASLQPIYDRLHAVAPYHPMSANTFADWSVEAGDIVTMSRNGSTSAVPVHNTHISWRGSPVVALNASGKEERDSIAKTSKRKYGRSGSGMVNSQALYYEMFSDDGRLHTELVYSESVLRVEFTNADSALRSEFEVTASHLRTEFTEADGRLESEFEITASLMRAEYTNNEERLKSEFELTASHLRTDFEDADARLYGELEITASHLETEFSDGLNSLRSELEITASHLQAEFTDETNSLRSELEITASQLQSEIVDTASGLSSRITQNANKVAIVVDGNNNINAAQIVAAINADGSSEAIISADHVYLDGNTTINSIMSVTNRTVQISAPLRIEGDVTAVSFTTRDGSNSATISDFTNVIKSASVSGNVLTLTPVVGEPITFSKATALSGAWSSGTLTVTATPQGNTYVETLVQKTALASWTSTSVDVPIYGQYGSSGQYEEDTGRSVYIDFSGKLEDKGTVTTNGLYVPDTANGYIGIRSINVDIPSQTVTPVISHTWSGSGLLTVATTPAAQSNLVRQLTQGSTSWSGDTATVPVNATYGSHGQYSESTGLNVTVDAQGRYTAGYNAGHTDGVASVTVYSVGQNGAATYSTTTGNYSIPIIGTASNSATKTGTVVISGSEAYNAGESAGQTSVTLNDPEWTNAIPYTAGISNTATVSTSGRPTQLSKSIPVTLSQGAWNNNAKTVDITTTNGTVVARTTVDASSIYTTGVTNGQNSIHLSKTWGTGNESNKVVFAKTTSGSTNTYTLTVTAGATIRYNTDTHTYTATGTASCDGGQKDIATSTSGAEAYGSGQDSVSIVKGNWSGGIVDFSKSVGTSDTKGVHLTSASPSWDGNTATVAIWDGTAADAEHGVNTGYTVTVNAGSIYTAGQNAVTLNSPVWMYELPYTSGLTNAVTVSTSGRPTQLSKSIPVTLTPSAWSNNAKTVDITTTNGTVVARTTVDASTLVTNANYAGRAAVTLTSSWNAISGTIPENRTLTVSTVNRTNTAGETANLQVTTSLYLTQASWSSNKLIVSMRSGGTSGTVFARTTVDASTLVQNAYYSGSYSVGLGNPTWSSSTGTLPSNRTVTVSTTNRTNATGVSSNISQSVVLYLTQSAWNNNTAIVYLRAGSASGTAYAQLAVDASSIYSNGISYGMDAVTIVKGSWNSGQISFTKSEGAADTKSVALTAADPTWSGTTASVAIWDGTAPDAQHGINTGCVVSVPTDEKLEETEITQNSGDNWITPGEGKIGFSRVKVNVPSTVVAPVISHTWSGSGLLTVSTTPAAQANLERQLSQGSTSWNGNTATVPVNAIYGSQGQYSESTGMNVTVDASSIYTAGQNSVSVISGTWTTSKTSDGDTNTRASVTFSPSVGSGAELYQEIAMMYKTEGSINANDHVWFGSGYRFNSTGNFVRVIDRKFTLVPQGWTNNVNTVDLLISRGETGTVYAHLDVDASGIYSNGYNDGKSYEYGIVRSRFNAASGSYYIEAYENISGVPGISNSSITYKLATSGSTSSTKVIITNPSGTQIGSTPELSVGSLYTDGQNAVTLNNPNWTYALPYTTGTTNGVTVSTSGRPTQLSKSVPVTLSQGSWSNNQKTVDITTTNGSVVARTTVDASTLVTNAGYAGRAAVTLLDPTWSSVSSITDSRTVTVSTTGRTNSSGTTDNQSKSVALYLTSSGTTVSLRTGSTSGTEVAKKSVSLTWSQSSSISTSSSEPTSHTYQKSWSASKNYAWYEFSITVSGTTKWYKIHLLS